MKDNKPKREYFNPVVEQMSRLELEGFRFKKLKYQLDYLFQNNEFYKKWFAKHKVKVDSIRSFEDFQKEVPLLRKQDLISDQGEHPPYGERLGISLEKIQLTNYTSGTSGKGQEVIAATHSDQEYYGLCWAYNFYWSGVRRGDVTINLFPMGILNAGFGAHMGFKQLGTNNFDIAAMDTKSIVEIMHRFKATYLLTTPAYLMRIIYTARQMGFDLDTDFYSLRGITVATEAYPVEWALEVQDLLQVELYEIYGCTQQGSILGSTCEEGVVRQDGQRGMIHCLEHLSAYEVLDRETQQPVQPGEFGELVLTNLTKHGSPAIRFATNDRVRFMPHDSCPCGRPFVGMEAGTISRYDDMLKIKGINVWPAGITEIILSPPETNEYNARVYMTDEGKEEVEIKVEFVSGVSEEKKKVLLAEMQKKVLDHTGLRMKFVEAAEVQKFEFKVKRWSDERQSGLALKKLR